MGIIDEIKGRAKGAMGALTDSNRLQRDGKSDRAAGKVKDGIDKAKEKATEVADKAQDAWDSRSK